VKFPRTDPSLAFSFSTFSFAWNPERVIENPFKVKRDLSTPGECSKIRQHKGLSPIN